MKTIKLFVNVVEDVSVLYLLYRTSATALFSVRGPSVRECLRPFKSLYLLNKWRYFNETGKSIARTDESDDTEKTTDSKVKFTEDIFQNYIFELI